MAGAAGGASRQAARAGLLAVLCAGCAKIENPPGGPPDFTAPVVLAIAPDSGAELDGFDDDFEIRFNEVISERSGGGLENLVRIAPRPEETRVSWKRSRVTAKPKDGWRPGVVYHVQLLPGFADLRNNRLDTTITVIFSTGGAIPATRLDGTVIDWEGSRVAAGALVEAVLLPDSLVYYTTADSGGDFTLTAVPPGNYLLLATVDQNGNGLRDARESFDSVSERLDSTLSHVFWTFAHDTTGPRLRSVAAADSLTVRFELSQPVDPSISWDEAVDVLELPDSVPVAVAAVWTEEVYDSVSERERAVADSLARLAADSAAADSLGADSLIAQVAADTTPADTTPSLTTSDTASQAAADSAAAYASRIAELIGLRPQLHAVWYVRLATPLSPGGRYVIVTRATNLSQATLESRIALNVPERPDST